MTFDEVLDDNNRSVFTLYVEYGGIAFNFDALSAYQQDVFVKSIYEHLGEMLAKNKSMSLYAYDKYAHVSAVRYPMWVVLCKDSEVLYSSYINSMVNTMESLLNHVGTDTVYLYNKKELNEFMLHSEHLEKIHDNSKICIRFKHAGAFADRVFDNFDEHIAKIKLTYLDTSTSKVSDLFYDENPMMTMKENYSAFVDNVNKKGIILNKVVNAIINI